MARRARLLTGLSTLAATGALALSACGSEGGAEGEGAKPADRHAGHAASGEGEGEGAAKPSAAVGGEAEAGAVASAASDPAAYLSALQIVRGHLKAGLELYAAGDRTLGPQHLRHPQAEILTSLSPAFAAYGAIGVVEGIDALAAASEAGAEPAALATLHGDAVKSIGAASEAANASVRDRLLAAAKTLTVAADEYSIAVKDGAIVNLHEYHDAWGFIAIVINDLESMTGGNGAETEAIGKALAQARAAATIAPTVTPPAGALSDASTIYGAAARIEIAARAL
jgi:hypothetical protein